jgi:hypothetical protein
MPPLGYTSYVTDLTLFQEKLYVLVGTPTARELIPKNRHISV